MSGSGEILLALARAAGVAVAAVGGGWVVRPLLTGVRNLRVAAWTLLLVAWLTPMAVVGYAYSAFSLSLIRHPAANALFYAALLAARFLPMAALILLFTPSFLTAEAVHCRRLACRSTGIRSWAQDVALRLRGAWRGLAAALTLTGLMVFIEFDLASLLGCRTWTVALFDAHAGGLALRESLRMAAVPALLGLLMAGAALALLARATPEDACRIEPPRRMTPFDAARMGLLALSFVLLTAIPLAMVLKGTPAGLRALFADFTLGRDIVAGLGFACASGLCAFVLAGALLRTGWGPAVARILCAVGLMGPLVLALLVLAAFQSPLLRRLYDTPLPLLFTLTLLFLPHALILRALVRRSQRGVSIHAAELLGDASSGRVRRRGAFLADLLRARGRFWILFLLFGWAYVDLTASAILAPTRLTPVFVRLYNLMHYGRIPMLSAMVVAAMLVPAVVLAAGLGLRAAYMRVRLHA